MSRRARRALALALFALACALLGAFGPSDPERSTYSWPPATLPAEEPERLWYAPLLLARHEPDSLAATIPCAPAPALAGAGVGGLVTVLATTRERSQGGLLVTRSDDTLEISIAGQSLERFELPAGAGDDCAFRLRVADRQWSVEGGTANIADTGTVDAMPRVDGIFSELDLRAQGAPSVEVTTVPHGTRTSILQELAWIAAALAALAALILVSGAPLTGRPWAAAVRSVGTAALQLRPVDIVVVLVLHVWWIVGPAFFDDGWVLARQRNYDASGGFSAYYTSYGTNFPLDFWLEWLQHWLVESTDALLVLRIPTLVCLVVLWFLCRIVVRRVTASVGEDAFVRWALASAFLAGALAWGMTLRPEPVVALLATGVLACTIRFLERGSTAPLAIGAVLLVLALAAHPTGIVVLAPALVALPALVRWGRVRPNLVALATVAIAAVALLGTIVTLGSSAEQRRADTAVLRTYGDETAGWRDELTRYSQLSQAPYSTGLRRGSVALFVLTVVAFVLRRRREPRDAFLDLPATALGVTLLLFLATPTKWPWHFGALIGLGAIAVAAETARLRDESRRAERWDPRPYFVVLGAVAAAGWAWFPRSSWNELDLRTMDWTLGLESRITLARAAAVVPVVLLGVLVLLSRRRGHQASWHAAALSAPAVAIPLIAFTIGVLVADLSKTDAWTLSRQNLDTLTGDLRCGLADETLIANDATALRRLGTPGGDARESSDLPPPPVENLKRFVLGPAESRSSQAATPWFSADRAEQVGVFVGGTPSPSDLLDLEWGGGSTLPLTTLAAGSIPLDSGPDSRPDLAPWRFVPAGALPPRPQGARAVRFVLRSDGVPGGAVALTAPVSYENALLADALEAEESRAFVLPNLVTYFPCAQQPAVARGVAEAPQFVVGLNQTVWPLSAGTSPFDALPRLYTFTRLPASDSPEPPQDVAVYAIDRRIPGGVEAPADLAG